MTAVAAALALSACSGEAEIDPEASEEAAGEAEMATPQVYESPKMESAEPPQLATADTLDPTYHGVWDYVEGMCDPMSDMRLEISGDRLEFYESGGDIVNIERESNGDRLVTVAMSGEGETWDTTFRFEMDSSGQFLIVSGTEEDGFDGVPRKRCS
ncbi:hypothetical protein [Aurantiacibacter sediminis]|uniref:hypothetical protein n=1 Tax=Aurantiacibacter sediminis TaxID=2793064 RepID=UPI0018DA12CA|nr:hypothetical protein [Aurantiacibacter sediminis]